MKKYSILSMGFFILALPLFAQTRSFDHISSAGDPSLVNAGITQPSANSPVQFDLRVLPKPELKGGPGDILRTTFEEDREREGSSKLSTKVPEPATMLLLGGGLISIAVIGRKKFFKKK